MSANRTGTALPVRVTFPSKHTSTRLGCCCRGPVGEDDLLVFRRVSGPEPFSQVELTEVWVEGMVPSRLALFRSRRQRAVEGEGTESYHFLNVSPIIVSMYTHAAVVI